MTKLLEAAKQRIAARDSARSDVERMLSTQEDMGRQLTKVGDAKSRKATLQRNLAAEAYLDGRDEPRVTELRAEILDLESQEQTLAAARALHVQRIEAAVAAASAAEEASSSAVVDLANDLRRAPLERIRKALAGLKADLASLAAAQLVQEKLVGKKFPVTRKQVDGLFDGAVLARKVIALFPDLVRPAWASKGAFETAVSEHAEAILRDLST